VNGIVTVVNQDVRRDPSLALARSPVHQGEQAGVSKITRPFVGILAEMPLKRQNKTDRETRPIRWTVTAETYTYFAFDAGRLP